jgi:2,3-diketo-5-methylthio-1-phosphopentane phosphatase
MIYLLGEIQGKKHTTEILPPALFVTVRNHHDMHVFCDFDGTITTVDTTDRVLALLARPEWESLEADWRAGQIDAATCMREQIALIEADDASLDRVLDQIELTPGFDRFVAWCAAQDVPLTIVSDGVDYFIHRILTRYGLGSLPVISNNLSGHAGAWRLVQPHGRAGCAAGAGVCKCQALAQCATPASRPAAGPSVVYIGDGRSDFCASARVDLLFARDELARYALGRGQPYHPFNDFDDVLAVLDSSIRARRTAAR